MLVVYIIGCIDFIERILEKNNKTQSGIVLTKKNYWIAKVKGFPRP